jgi:glycosyltransferase involved in cell wall biosynthesis
MKPLISVILCTHNPRLTYLTEVLQALNTQVLAQEKWELLVIDNASQQPLVNEIDLSWHSNARVIREEHLGLIVARIRGITESVGEILTFVDDDNVLAADYLSIVLRIAQQYPMLGTWGAGMIQGQFEVEPPATVQPYLGNIAVFQSSQDAWSNATQNNHALPCGAGLCVRRDVAETYAQEMVNKPGRNCLGRRGTRLTSCEDEDLAMTSCKLGLGTARLMALRLTHLIPKERLTEDYFLRLNQGFGYSKIMLNYIHGIPNYKRSPLRVLLERYRSRKKDDFSKKLENAWRQGEAEAWRDVDRMQRQLAPQHATVLR